MKCRRQSHGAWSRFDHISLIFDMAKTTATGAQYAGMKRQPKPVNAQQLYRTLHSQLDEGFHDKALKTVEKRALL